MRKILVIACHVYAAVLSLAIAIALVKSRWVERVEQLRGCLNVDFDDVYSFTYFTSLAPGVRPRHSARCSLSPQPIRVLIHVNDKSASLLLNTFNLQG
jgi:hypothetical protein